MTSRDDPLPYSIRERLLNDAYVPPDDSGYYGPPGGRTPTGPGPIAAPRPPTADTSDPLPPDVRARLMAMFAAAPKGHAAARAASKPPADDNPPPAAPPLVQGQPPPFTGLTVAPPPYFSLPAPSQPAPPSAAGPPVGAPVQPQPSAPPARDDWVDYPVAPPPHPPPGVSVSQPPAWARYAAALPPGKSTGADVMSGLNRGLAEGAGRAAGAPGDTPHLMAQALGLIAPQTAQAAEEDLDTGYGYGRIVPQLPSSDTITRYLTKAANAIGVNTDKPTTTPGKYAETISSFAPTAAMMGASSVPDALKAIARYGVIPGAATEAAGEAAEGSPVEPYARTAAAIAAGRQWSTEDLAHLAHALAAGHHPIPAGLLMRKLASAILSDPAQAAAALVPKSVRLGLLGRAGDLSTPDDQSGGILQ